MKDCPPGLKRIKSQLMVNAPVERCYQAWMNSAKMPDFMSRVIQVDQKKIPLTVMTNPQDIEAQVEARIPLLDQNGVPYSTIKNWLLKGPGGKLYEIANTAVLEIPNHFYCTTSTDPDDISVQSSAFFCPDGKNQHTLIEWEISFWPCLDIGSMTRLACDILQTDDHFMEQCLQDFKDYIERDKNRAKPEQTP